MPTKLSIAAIAIAAILVLGIAGYFLLGNNNSTNSVTPNNNSYTATYNSTYNATYNYTYNATYLATFNETYNKVVYPANNLPVSNTTGGPLSPFIKVALANYKAPYCQGSSQAPVGSNGLPCAAEVGSTYYTFNSVSGAFDCAGFIQYIYSQFGIKLPVTAQAQFGNFYKDDAKVVPVPGGQANTVPGDLVYFSIPGDHDPTEPAHVAMCYVAGYNIIIQDGGPPPGWPGTVANLDAVLCTASNSNPAKCVMGFMQVTGASNFISNGSEES